tara:strand:- start:1556 stop:2203 length:648 start_codon:yes stop_codon:yes gene_type:complete
MNEILPSGQYDVTKKNKLIKFYDKYKILIFSILSVFLIILASLNIYSYLQNKKKISLSNKYATAQIYIKNQNKIEAFKILSKIIYSDDSTYSTLSLFEIIDEKLESDNDQISKFFFHILENNKFDNEVKNLIILKKAIFETNFSEEQKLLETIKPLINEKSLWKPHALIIAGNYFYSKGEKLKAKDFFTQVLDIENINKELLDQAKFKLRLIFND